MDVFHCLSTYYLALTLNQFIVNNTFHQIIIINNKVNFIIITTNE